MNGAFDGVSYKDAFVLLDYEASYTVSANSYKAVTLSLATSMTAEEKANIWNDYTVFGIVEFEVAKGAQIGTVLCYGILNPTEMESIDSAQILLESTRSSSYSGTARVRFSFIRKDLLNTNVLEVDA
jgi:hypothetical protein